MENTVKVLIVDDEEIISRNVESKLLRLKHNVSYTIYKARSARQAEDMFDEIQPDIVITDICMPKVSGLTLIKNIRKKNRTVSLFVLSGYGDFDYVREAFLLGVNDYLLKPLSLSELDEKLTKHTSKLNQKILTETESNETEKIKKIKEYITKNLARNISMQEVADYSGMSYNYFSKLFKDKIGISYSQYINLKRMEVAKELLEDSTYKIADIAKKIGFENPNHFSRAFQKTYGMYPTEYQKSMGIK